MAQLLVAAVAQQGGDTGHDAGVRLHGAAAVLAAVVIAGGVQKLHHGGYSLCQLLHLIGVAEADIQGQLHPAAPDGDARHQTGPLDELPDGGLIRLLPQLVQGQGHDGKAMIVAPEHGLVAADAAEEDAALAVHRQVQTLGGLVQKGLFFLSHGVVLLFFLSHGLHTTRPEDRQKETTSSLGFSQGAMAVTYSTGPSP